LILNEEDQMASGQSKQEIWKEHIEKAGRHPGGAAAYCRQAGINSPGFYQWRKKLLGKKVGRAVGGFVPVEVQGSVMRDFSNSKIDAEWVGQMLASFVRGLS
jgi:hypothetical protein